MSRRKIGLGVGICMGLLMIGVAMWEWWLPGRAVGEIQERLAERFGMECTVEQVDFDLTTVGLIGVQIRSPERALEVSIEEVELDTAPWGLAMEGARAFSGVVVRGARVQLHVDLPGAGRSFDRIRRELTARGDPGAAQSPQSDAGERRVELQDSSLVILDRSGVLLDIEGGSGTLEAGAFDTRAESLTMGAPTTDQIELGGVNIRGSRPSGARFLESVQIAAIRVALSPYEEQGTPTTPPDDDGASLLPSASLIERPLVARLSRALRAIVGESGSGGRSSQAGAVATGQGFDAVLRRLRPGFRARFASVDLVSRLSEQEEVPLAQLNGQIHMPQPGQLHLEGRGEASGGGEVSLDLRLRPAEYEVVGRVRISGMPLAIAVPFLPALPWHRPERARVAADLTIDDSSRERFAFQGRVAISGLAFSSRRLASEPVEDISVGLSGAGTWTPEGRLLVLQRGEVSLGSARVGVSGQLAWPPGRYRADLRATLPSTPCRAVVEAPPPDMMQEVQGFALSGHFSARMDLQVDSEDLDATTLSLDARDGCSFSQVPPIADLLRVQGPFRHRVLEPDGSVFAMTTGPGTPNWVSRSGISPFFVAALLTREDGGFYRHSGFSVSSIRDALVRNLKEERFVHGASTITMQLAKNLFLQREKTLARKAQEVFLTWMLERQLSKDEIITLYANIVEFGRSLYGIRAAARRYFGRSAAGLSPAEATFLACILTQPKVYHGMLFSGGLSDSMRSRMGRVLRRMGARGRISPEEMQWGLAELPAFGFRSAGAPMREPWSPPDDEPQQAGEGQPGEEPLPGDPERAAPAEAVEAPAPGVDDGSWEPNAWDLGASTTQW